MAEFLSEMDALFDDSEGSKESSTSEDSAFRDMFLSSFVESFQRFSSTIVQYTTEKHTEDFTSAEQLKKIHEQLYDLALQDGVLSQKEKDFLDKLGRQWNI